MTIRGRDEGDTRRFASVADLIRAAEEPAPFATRQSSRAEERGRGEGWYLSESFAHAKRLAFGGWDEGTALVSRVRVSVPPSVKPRTVYRRSVTGPGAIVVPDVIKGLPDPYRVRRTIDKPVNTRGKIVRILLNVCVSGGISTDIYLRRGGAIVALADALERQGKRVEIVVGAANDGHGMRRDIFVTVKRAQDKINVPTLAFAVAHPSFFRRFLFGIYERWDEKFVNSQVNNGGYGQVGTFATRDGVLDKFDIYMDGARYGDAAFASVETTERWIRENLAKYGVQV